MSLTKLKAECVNIILIAVIVYALYKAALFIVLFNAAILLWLFLWVFPIGEFDDGQ